MTDPPLIAMGNSTVEVVEEMKYLGVLWDHTMFFYRHLKAVRQKTDYLTHRLSIIAAKLYSKKPSLLKRIYKGAIEPYILQPQQYTERFSPSDYEQVVDLWDSHPPLRKSIPFDLSEPFGSEIEIYTDGSGLVVLYYGQKIHSEMRDWKIMRRSFRQSL
ncbi:RNase H domain-containing protein [Caerostris extrusa]|uniref:RNase H domain-containing protein n=1 Tax=Caerostris extrusa TaxID=172846 RepID=A0AAV4W6M3_CAEEX|nr:RNase H domain-containing protein [Caerostris extrusa]